MPTDTTPSISVIVPVYNTEAEYLDQCIESILSQKGVDFELIIVDDGSDAHTHDHVDRLAGKDVRIRAIHTTNGGLSHARNRGLDIARGQYITFVDSDDMLFAGALSLLHRMALHTGCAICIGGHSQEKCGKASTRNFTTVWSDDALQMCLYQTGSLIPSTCGALYRRTLFEKIRFTEGTFYEDLDLVDRLFLSSGEIAFTKDPVYFYRQHPNSFLHRWSEHRKDVLRVTQGIEQRLGSRHPSLVAAARDRRLSANFNIFILASQNGATATADECWATIKALRMASLRNPKVRLKNKVGILLSLGGRKLFSTFARWSGM